MRFLYILIPEKDSHPELRFRISDARKIGHEQVHRNNNV
jgi:hypothetical protein